MNIRLLDFFRKRKEEEPTAAPAPVTQRADNVVMIAMLDYYGVKDVRQLEILIRKHYYDGGVQKSSYPVFCKTITTDGDKNLKGVIQGWR